MGWRMWRCREEGLDEMMVRRSGSVSGRSYGGGCGLSKWVIAMVLGFVLRGW